MFSLDFRKTNCSNLSNETVKIIYQFLDVKCCFREIKSGVEGILFIFEDIIMYDNDLNKRGESYLQLQCMGLK